MIGLTLVQQKRKKKKKKTRLPLGVGRDQAGGGKDRPMGGMGGNDWLCQPDSLLLLYGKDVRGAQRVPGIRKLGPIFLLH